MWHGLQCSCSQPEISTPVCATPFPLGPRSSAALIESLSKPAEGDSDLRYEDMGVKSTWAQVGGVGGAGWEGGRTGVLLGTRCIGVGSGEEWDQDMCLLEAAASAEGRK